MSDTYQPFEIELDLENVEAWNGERRPLVPEGTYHVKVTKVTNEGKYVAVAFEVLEGEHAGSFAYNNYMTGTKPGQARLKQLMIACGASLGRFVSDELIGASLYVDVVHSVGKARVNEMGEPMETTVFANVQNERRELAEGEIAAPKQPEGEINNTDPEPPPITRSTPPADTPSSTNGKAAPRGRRA